VVEVLLADNRRPSPLQIGDAKAGADHQVAASLRQVDELCPAARANTDDYRYARQGFSLGEKLTKAWPLVAAHRLIGPTDLVVKLLFDSLVGSDAIAAQPDQAATVMASFRDADRTGMYHAMRSMMLGRAGVEHLLADIKVPTLVMSVRDDAVGWRPNEARRTCAVIPDCRVEEVAGAGHVAPLLVDRERILRLVTDLWAAAVPNPNPAK
jgi:pimeloyl-ACP methyl ester carboxylesterase